MRLRIQNAAKNSRRPSAWQVLLRGPELFSSKRRAVIMILVLWVVVVLGIIASSLAFDVQVSSKLTLIQREQFIAYNLAKSAIAVGMTHLQNDLLIEQQ